jgi:hypothetical protein
VQEALDALCQRSGSICNLLVGPGEDLASAFGRLEGVQDALICLRAGTYTLTAPVVLANRGHFQIVGAGPGTRIVVPGGETALRFRSCASVKVSNLSVEAGALTDFRQERDGLGGALTFDACGSVTVEGVRARCAGGPVRAGTCITVRHPAPAVGSQAVIRGNELDTGHQQTGLLIVNVDRSVVTDNVVRAGARPADEVLLANPQYRGALRRQLITGVVRGPEPPASANATVTFAGQTVHFRTDLGLIRAGRDNEWQRLINSANPGGITNPRLLRIHLLRLASELLRTRAVNSSSVMRTVVTRIIAQDAPVAGQGIVVGGELANDVRVTGNTVLDAIQGVHVGLAMSGSGPTLPRAAGTVLINDNTIRVTLASSTTRSRHGIYCGAVDSLVMEGNRLLLARRGGNSALRVEGVRIFGVLGRRVIVRHNHMGSQLPLAQFTVGVTFGPLNFPLPTSPMWIVTENEMESSPLKVDVPPLVDVNAVRARIRGVNDNFA